MHRRPPPPLPPFYTSPLPPFTFFMSSPLLYCPRSSTFLLLILLHSFRPFASLRFFFYPTQRQFSWMKCFPSSFAWQVWSISTYADVHRTMLVCLIIITIACISLTLHANYTFYPESYTPHDSNAGDTPSTYVSPRRHHGYRSIKAGRIKGLIRPSDSRINQSTHLGDILLP